MLWKDGKKKAVTLSYDDAVIHDRRFIKLLRKYGLKCTFNLPSSWIGDTTQYVNDEDEPKEEFGHIVIAESEFKDLYDDFEVASHAAHHPNLVGLPFEEVQSEILDDVKRLEELSGKKVKGFAYPYGAYDDELVDRLKKFGIVYARTVNSTSTFGIPEDFLRWRPTTYNEAPDFMDVAKKFIECDEEGALFYLWGHTYEFYLNNSWDKIEEFMKLMASHKDEIWFATNMEIYEYVQAHK